MFTGIIEEKCKIVGMKSSGDNIFIEIASGKVVEDIAIGNSIAVNGTCLTVVAFKKNQFTVEATKATLEATNLKFLKSGSFVNLERAMSAKGRFDGHFVMGHVDGTATVRQVKRSPSAVSIEISAGKELLKYMIDKGSVAVNGISLTIMELTDSGFVLNIIPHTLKETALDAVKAGDVVNIETDMLGKYILKGKEAGKELNEEFLKENGFI